ncbi:hypothetical protein EJ05DRAFT_496421 [Pseudovirgaria hyperparasitica]|uniref:Putative gamma-glutamylcyclotransferase n=1 Tax=Pseudovirgaria hyperparasitica TaxID=470096 RepID=A0A6A6WFA9_9PEZI|nr:uncharacterized protein EJ05DRAFT_496421 [Pseudovirgaria hyperparasitica]KAF2761508.1 hypothetical protein EJ05DRAFT_496421 [Pseudovirgaria hyperparasitica]
MTHAPPPPPPPLPPTKAVKSSDTIISLPKPRPMPPQAYNGPLVDNVRYMAANTSALDRPFQPCYMFFYGSLMDPEVIQAVLSLADLPTTRSATISGFQIKMWGIYPALVPSTSGAVTGVVWKVDSEKHFERLAAYETSAYDWLECEAMLGDGTVLPRCRTFCWAGRPDSNELEEGHFDLQRYQRYFKPSVTRRRSPAP